MLECLPNNEVTVKVGESDKKFVTAWKLRESARQINCTIVQFIVQMQQIESVNYGWKNTGKYGISGRDKLQIGKRQAFGLGKEVRSFIGKFIDTDYKADQAKFYSSSANRCKMTLQVGGFFIWILVNVLLRNLLCWNMKICSQKTEDQKYWIIVWWNTG